MTVYILGIIATALWIDSNHARTTAAEAVNTAAALGCAAAAILLAMLG